MASVFDSFDINDARIAAQQSLYPNAGTGYGAAPGIYGAAGQEGLPSPVALEMAGAGQTLSMQNPAYQLEMYRRMIGGDMFRAWAGWIGPVPLSSDPDAQLVRAEIERGFVSRNVLGEVVGRHVNGVLGRDVKLSIVTRRKLAKDEQPTPDEQARIDEATDLLTKWIDDRKLNQEYDKLCENLLIAGQACQRVFVAPGSVNAQGVVPQADLATSLDRIYFNFPLPGQSVVYTDPITQAKCSIYLYRQVLSSRPSVSAGAYGEERAELTYLDGEQTIVRIVGADMAAGGSLLAVGEREKPSSGQQPTANSQQPDFSYPLGKRLLMSEMRRRPLLNPQVVSLQKLINLSLTMMERNTILGGFLERCALNGQLNGHYETEADGSKKFVYDELPVGAGALTTLTGIVLHDAAGNESITSPNMLYRDPVSTATFIATIDAAYQAILAECNQLHYSMVGDSHLSGISRQVAMTAYLVDLLQTKQQVDLGFSTLCETSLALAANLSGQPGYFDDLRVSAECSVDAGPVTPQMMQQTQALAGGQQLLSIKTAQGWIGVEDSDAEQAQMADEAAKASQAAGPDLAGVQQLLDQARGTTPAPGNPSQGYRFPPSGPQGVLAANGNPANGQPHPEGTRKGA